MSRTLKQVKEDYAESLYYYSFQDLVLSYDDTLKGIKSLIKITNDIAKIYSEEQNKDLVEWKKGAMKVFKDLDFQNIGKYLDLKLGSSIAPQVLPKIKELVDRNKELVEMLNKAKERLYTVESPSTSCRYVADEIKELLTKYK